MLPLYLVTRKLKLKSKKNGKIFADDILSLLLIILIFLVTIAEIFTPFSSLSNCSWFFDE